MTKDEAQAGGAGRDERLRRKQTRFNRSPYNCPLNAKHLSIIHVHFVAENTSADTARRDVIS